MGFGKQNTGVIIRESDNVALGAFADGDVALLSGITPTEDFRMMKTEIVAILRGLTAGEGVGIQLGITNGELSQTEVEECLDIDGPLDRNDRNGEEKANRFVKTIGATGKIGASDTSSPILDLHTGAPVVVARPNWTFSNPEGWNFFAQNAGGLALTTGSTIQLQATHYGVWVT